MQLGVTRDNLTASPQYSYHVTPLMSVVASALVETVKFSPSDTADHVDFDYYQGGLSINRALDQKTDLSIGAFGNRYDAGSVGSYATSAGASLNLDHNWTPLVGGTASVSYQHSDITVEQPNEFQAGVNTWGAWGSGERPHRSIQAECCENSHTQWRRRSVRFGAGAGAVHALFLPAPECYRCIAVSAKSSADLELQRN